MCDCTETIKTKGWIKKAFESRFPNFEIIVNEVYYSNVNDFPKKEFIDKDKRIYKRYYFGKAMISKAQMENGTKLNFHLEGVEFESRLEAQPIYTNDFTFNSLFPIENYTEIIDFDCHFQGYEVILNQSGVQVGNWKAVGARDDRSTSDTFYDTFDRTLYIEMKGDVPQIGDKVNTGMDGLGEPYTSAPYMTPLGLWVNPADGRRLNYYCLINNGEIVVPAPKYE